MRFSTRDITYVSLFTAIAIVAAMLIRYGSSIVPFSLMPFVVMLAGAVLGRRLAAISMAVYVLLGLVGVPIFAKPPFGGPSYVFQPTFGFLLSYIGAAYVTGLIVDRTKQPTFLGCLLAALAGLLVIYLIGLPYLWAILNLYLGKNVDMVGVLKIGFIPFIGADILKAVAAAGLARVVTTRLYRLGLKPSRVT